MGSVNGVGMNSEAFFTIAKTMREQNKEPHQLMMHSEYSAASGIYAVVKAMESIASGLLAEEERQMEEMMRRNLETIERMRQSTEIRKSYLLNHVDEEIWVPKK